MLNSERPAGPWVCFAFSSLLLRLTIDEKKLPAIEPTSFATVLAGAWPNPADNEHNISWVREYYAALEPHSSLGGYINFMDGDDQGRIQENYKGNYERLVSVKKKYDPNNLFHLNQNIKPQAAK